MRSTKLFMLVVSVLIAASPLLNSACSSEAPPPKTANVQPGEMPPGGAWSGVYYNAIFGYLHLIADGDTFEGRWLRADESRWGEMTGKITGDVARFDWVEHTIGLVGPSSKRTGKGYFRYNRPEGDNVDDRLLGEWGFDDAEIGGGEWDSIKQRNRVPDLKSVGGSSDATVGSWK